MDSTKKLLSSKILFIISSLVFLSLWVISVLGLSNSQSVEQNELKFDVVRAADSTVKTNLSDLQSSFLIDNAPIISDALNSKVNSTSNPGANTLASKVEGWSNIMTENFEGIFPSTGWNVSGDPTWDDDNYKAMTGGSWSGRCDNGGSKAISGSANYLNSMNARMTYGPFSLNGASQAQWEFYYWNKSELNYDKLYFEYSIDGVNFTSHSYATGDSNGWQNKIIDLSNLAGQNNVWISYRFISDGSGTDLGAFVDNIVLKKYVAPFQNPTLDVSGTSISPLTTSRGNSFTASYKICNTNAYKIQVYLGASIRKEGDSSDGNFDPAHDIQVDAAPSGCTTQSRTFVINSNNSPGNYQYKLAIWSGPPGANGSTQYGTTGWKSGLTIVNRSPSLTNANVSPETGTTAGSYTYQVTYTDLDGDTPNRLQVYIDDVVHDMTYKNGTVTAGALYEYTTNNLSAGSHKFYFSANDTYGAYASTSTIFKPVVSNPNNSPTVSVPTVSPNPGYVSDQFTYKITYYDLNNDSPAKRQIKIDNGSWIDMQPVNILDNVYWDGAEYYYTTNLSAGQHGYQMAFNDGIVGHADIPQSTYIGPMVNNRAPNKPNSPNPSDYQAGLSVNPTLRWSGSDPDGNLTKYNFYSGKDCANPPYYGYTTNITSPSYTPTNLDYNQPYCWKVEAVDAAGLSTFSDIWHFTTEVGNLPPSLSLLSVNPLSGSLATDFTFKVTYTDINNDAPTKRQLIVYQSNNPSISYTYDLDPVSIFDLTYSDGKDYSKTIRLARGQYSYKFVFNDGQQNHADVIDGQSGAPNVLNRTPVFNTNVVTSPVDNATNVVINPDVTWDGAFSDPDADTISYDFYLGTSENNLSTVSGCTNLARTGCQLNSLTNDTLYSWKVIAKDTYGDITSSKVYKFTTKEGLKILNTKITDADGNDVSSIINKSEVQNRKLVVQTNEAATVSWAGKIFAPDGVNKYSLVLDKDNFNWVSWDENNLGASQNLQIDASSGDNLAHDYKSLVPRDTIPSQAAYNFSKFAFFFIQTPNQVNPLDDIPSIIEAARNQLKNNQQLPQLLKTYSINGETVQVWGSVGKYYGKYSFEISILRTGDDTHFSLVANAKEVGQPAKIQMHIHSNIPSAFRDWSSVEKQNYLAQFVNKPGRFHYYPDDLVSTEAVYQGNSKYFNALFKKQNYPYSIPDFDPMFTVQKNEVGVLSSLDDDVDAMKSLFNEYKAWKVAQTSISESSELGLLGNLKSIPTWAKSVNPKLLGGVTFVSGYALGTADILSSTKGNKWVLQSRFTGNFAACTTGSIVAVAGISFVTGGLGTVPAIIAGAGGCLGALSLAGDTAENFAEYYYRKEIAGENINWVDVSDSINRYITTYGRQESSGFGYRDWRVDLPNGNIGYYREFLNNTGADRYYLKDEKEVLPPDGPSEMYLVRENDNIYYVQTARGWVKIYKEGDYFVRVPWSEPPANLERLSLTTTPAEFDKFKKKTGPGQPVNHYFIINNFDSRTTTYQLVLDNFRLPNGWTATLDNPEFTLMPGTSKLLTLTVTPPVTVQQLESGIVKVNVNFYHSPEETMSSLGSMFFETKDDPPPIITTNNGQDLLTNNANIILEGTAVNVYNQVLINGSANGVSFDSQNGTWRYSGNLQEGENQIEVTGKTSQGTISDPSKIKITLDTQTPTASVNIHSGTYFQQQTINLISDDPTAKIYYTLDGNEPAPNSLWYSNPIIVNKNTTLKLFAIDQAGNQSEIKTEVYNIDLRPREALALSAGWQMISLPGTITDLSIFGTGAEFKQFNNATQAYQSVTQMNPLEGYWIKVPEVRNIIVPVDEINLSQVNALSLPAGFMQISNFWLEHANELKLNNGTEAKTLAEAIQAGWIKDKAFYYQNGAYQYIDLTNFSVDQVKGKSLLIRTYVPLSISL